MSTRLDLTPRFGQARNQSQTAPAEIVVATDLSEFASVWPRTNSRGSARCFPFQCADVLELICETVVPARGANVFFVAISNGAGEPLALLPLLIEQVEDYSPGFGTVRVLKFLDGGLADYNAPVLFPAIARCDESAAEVIWRGLRKALPPFDIASFEKMADSVGGLANPLSPIAKGRLGVSGHAVALSGSWEEFATKLPKRNTWKSRRFRELGLNLEIAQNPEQYDTFVEALIQQKRRRYLETRGVDGLERPGYLTYLRSARRLIYPSGPVCLFALKAGDTIIGTNLGFISGKRFNGQFTTFEDGPWREFSPGVIHMNMVAEWCFKAGLEILDFGVGDDKYKAKYCDIDVPLYYAELPISFRTKLLFKSRAAVEGVHERRSRASREKEQAAAALAADDHGGTSALCHAGKAMLLWPSPSSAGDFLKVLMGEMTRRWPRGGAPSV